MLNDRLAYVQFADSGPTIPIANMLLDLGTKMFEDVAYCYRGGLPESTVGENLHI